MALIGKAVAEAPAVAADRIGVEGSRDFILYQRQVIAHAVADGYSSVIAAMHDEGGRSVACYLQFLGVKSHKLF